MLTTKSLYVHLKVKMIHDTRKLETNVTIMKTKPYLRAMHKKIAKKNVEDSKERHSSSMMKDPYQNLDPDIAAALRRDDDDENAGDVW